MRISGLASGIDTDSMVEQMMKVEQLKVDRVEQDKQVSTWRQEAFNDLNKDFANFILDSRKDFGLSSSSAFGGNSHSNFDWVKGASSSNEDVATVSSTSKVADGTYNVEVKELAKGVNLASGKDIRAGGSEFIDEKGNLTITEDLTFKINGAEIVVGKESSMNDVVKAINSAEVDGESIGVRASYDRNIGRFFLQTINTGKDAEIKIEAEGEAASFIGDLGLTSGSEGEEFIIGKALNGQQAVVNFNGANNIEFASNNININGIDMTLKAEGKFTTTVSTDVDAVYEKIENFVQEYNNLIDKTSELLSEKRYKSFHPLSNEEKQAMTDDDVKLWEEKAKSGMLSRDRTVERTMQNIRQALYAEEDNFDGSFSFITQIGISTEKYSQGSAGGKLEINEEKLRKAIAQDSEGVMELLFRSSEKPGEDGVGGHNGGLVTRVYEGLMEGMEDIVKKSGPGANANLLRQVKSNMLIDFVTKGSISDIDREVRNYDKKINELNILLGRREESYYAQFTAMEKAIARMNQQSDSLQSMLMF